MSSQAWLAHTQEWRNGYARGYTVGSKLAGRVRGVRFREGVAELRCGSCADGGGAGSYWPLTEEFWTPGNLRACKACIALEKRLDAKRRYWSDPETHRKLARDYYARHAKVAKFKQRVRYAANSERMLKANREWREANREAIRAYRRAYYAKNRDKILLREKLRRAGVVTAKAA